MLTSLRFLDMVQAEERRIAAAKKEREEEESKQGATAN